MGLVVVLPVLVGQLELRTPVFTSSRSLSLSLPICLYPVLTGIVAAFVDGDLFSLLPGEQGMKAVGAVVLGLPLESSLHLKEFAADLAQKLGPLLPVVVVEVLHGEHCSRDTPTRSGTRGEPARYRTGANGLP